MVDDEKSIYVGGIPYDCTEDSLRSVFDLYGAVIAIKLINDKNVGGKCYAFVTFSNPRSAQDAIIDMNGRTIGGRVVRVNEVRTRTNTNHESFGTSGTSGGIRGLYQTGYRYRERSRENYRSRESSFDRNRDGSLDRGLDEDRPSDRGRKRDGSLDEDRLSDRGRRRDGSLDRDLDREGDEDEKKDRNNKPQGGRVKDHDDQLDELRDELEKYMENRDNLQKKVDLLNDKIDEKQHDISNLQKKSQKLENGLVSAQKITSEKKLLLNKLHRSFVQFKKYEDKIKVSGEELQALVNEAMEEIDEDVSPNVNGIL